MGRGKAEWAGGKRKKEHEEHDAGLARLPDAKETTLYMRG